MKQLFNFNISKNYYGMVIPLLIVIVLLSSTFTFAQSTKINSYLQMVATGKVDIVKTKIPELITQYGEEPGILLLQGVVLENAEYAVPYYKKIIEKYPNSEWAPQAMWRMIQYYAICSDTTAAKNMLNKFKEKHPTSPFLSPASDLVGISISDAKFNNREKYHNPTKEEKSITTTNDAANNKNTDAVVNKEKYGLQVGIYSTHEAADSERSRFIKTAKLRTEVLEKLVLGEKKYAVVIGNYNSEEEALKAQSIVEKQCNCKSLIFKKQ